MRWHKKGPQAAWDEELVWSRPPGGCPSAAMWSRSAIPVRDRVVDGKNGCNVFAVSSTNRWSLLTLAWPGDWLRPMDCSRSDISHDPNTPFRSSAAAARRLWEGGNPGQPPGGRATRGPLSHDHHGHRPAHCHTLRE